MTDCFFFAHSDMVMAQGLGMPCAAALRNFLHCPDPETARAFGRPPAPILGIF